MIEHNSTSEIVR